MSEAQTPSDKPSADPATGTDSGDTTAGTTSDVDTASEPMVFDIEVTNWLPDWLEPSWQFLATYPLVLVLVLVVVAYLISKFIKTVFSNGLRKITSRSSTVFDGRLIEAVNRPIASTIIIFALLIGTVVLKLPETFHNISTRLLLTVLVFVWTRAAMSIAHLVLEIVSRNRHRFDIIQPRTLPAFDMALKILVFGASMYLFMLVWNINPTAWLASAGVIGLAVGFAAKDTLANFFSGIFIIADAPYKIGDYIILDTGERGVVRQLGMRSTRLLTRDDIEITVPNAVIGNAKIINESGGPWEKERIRIPVGVAYGSDLDEVVQVLFDTALAHEEISRQPEPRVRMRAFGISSLDFELLGWINHPELRGRIVHELHMNIYKAFNEAGIQIPFPQQDVHVRSMPDVAKEPDVVKD